MPRSSGDLCPRRPLLSTRPHRLALELRRKPDSSPHRGSPPVSVGIASHFCEARPIRPDREQDTNRSAARRMATRLRCNPDVGDSINQGSCLAPIPPCVPWPSRAMPPGIGFDRRPAAPGPTIKAFKNAIALIGGCSACWPEVRVERGLGPPGRLARISAGNVMPDWPCRKEVAARVHSATRWLAAAKAESSVLARPKFHRHGQLRRSNSAAAWQGACSRKSWALIDALRGRRPAPASGSRELTPKATKRHARGLSGWPEK